MVPNVLLGTAYVVVVVDRFFIQRYSPLTSRLTALT